MRSGGATHQNMEASQSIYFYNTKADTFTWRDIRFYFLFCGAFYRCAAFLHYSLRITYYALYPVFLLGILLDSRCGWHSNCH